MIETIHIHNFQCHKDLTINLGRSTVLSGDSNKGKTAILRALYWVMFNTPQGNAYISEWARTPKGKFKDGEYTEVTIAVDGHIITRRRDSKFNGYIVDGEKYEALRTDVPSVVTSILNLSDASIQRQMDPPFLLGMSASSASQYLASLAGLNNVDDILSTAKRLTSDKNKNLAVFDERISDLKKQIESLNWVDEATGILNHIETLNTFITETTEILNNLNTYVSVTSSLSKLTHIDDEVSKLTWVDTSDLETRLSDLCSTIEQFKNIPYFPEIPKWLLNYDASVVKTLEASLDSVTKYINAKSTLDSISAILNQIDENLWVDSSNIANALSDIETSIASYNTGVDMVKKCNSSLRDLYKDLDGMVCPTCGQPVNPDLVLCH